MFRNGNIDSFLLSTPKFVLLFECSSDQVRLLCCRSLNRLNHLHIWHDNSGESGFASWFLKCFIVKDLQTEEIFYFIAQRWFAVEEDDGKVTLLVSSRLVSSLHSREYRLDRTIDPRGQ